MKKLVILAMVMVTMVTAFTGCKTDGRLLKPEKHETNKAEEIYRGDLMDIAYKAKFNW